MLKKIFQFITIVFAFLLFIAGFAMKTNPDPFWMLSFIGISYPFLLVSNMLLFLVLLIFLKSKKTSLIPLLAILVTYSSFQKTFNISAPERTVDEISILTWNVKNFDLYNWSHNKETHELMMQLLEDKSPDILCLQEFYYDKKNFKNIKEIKKRLGYKYFYFGETLRIKKNKNWGLITFSKYPILNKGQIKFEKGSRLNSCIYTDIVISKEKTCRVYNTHLQSLHFGEDDYEYLKELKEEQKPDFKNSIKIARKLKKGFVKRAKQANLILEHKDEFDGKSIICGDFNDTPYSYAYNLLIKNMQDAFIEKGLGIGKTLVNPTPFFRIDFVFMNQDYKINSYNTYQKRLSDHFPVQVFFEL